MVEVARKVDKADREALILCAEHLKKMDQHQYAAECYSKLGDTKALLSLHIEARHWDEVGFF